MEEKKIVTRNNVGQLYIREGDNEIRNSPKIIHKTQSVVKN